VFGGHCALVAANVVSFLFCGMDFEISLLTTEIAGGFTEERCTARLSNVRPHQRSQRHIAGDFWRFAYISASLGPEIGGQSQFLGKFSVGFTLKCAIKNGVNVVRLDALLREGG